jgi:hypothetical protein
MTCPGSQSVFIDVDSRLTRLETRNTAYIRRSTWKFAEGGIRHEKLREECEEKKSLLEHRLIPKT